jgi:hypothetical protein
MPFRYSFPLLLLIVIALTVFHFEQAVHPRISEVAEASLWMATFCLFGLFPLIYRTLHFFRVRRELDLKMKQVGGFCGACGYNLRGVNSLKCPECGSARGVDTNDEKPEKGS